MFSLKNDLLNFDELRLKNIIKKHSNLQAVTKANIFWITGRIDDIQIC